jgi:predicted nucleotidyltransferase
MKPIVINKNQDIYGDTARGRILSVLYKNPEEEFSLSSLAEKSKVAKANIGKIIINLEDMGIIVVEKLSKIWRIRAQISNKNYINGKILYNLSLIYNSNLIEYLVDHFRNPKSISLFGSFRNGEDISTSDLDIAIEKDDIKEYKTIELNELGKIEKFFQRKIQLHVFNRKIIDDNLFNNIVNGITLNGFVEVSK